MAEIQEAVLAGDSKKRRKKQAKREAKLMLKVDEAREVVRGAEQKVAKAQSKLGALQAQLQELEAQLEGLRSAHSSSAEEDIVAPGDITDVSEDISGLPPAEGRTDIGPEVSGGQEPEIDADEESRVVLEVYEESVEVRTSDEDVNQIAEEQDREDVEASGVETPEERGPARRSRLRRSMRTDI